MTIAQRRSTISALLAVTTALAASGCGDSSTEVRNVASVAVTPNAASLQFAETQQLTATPLDASGGTVEGREVTWSTSDPAVADVSAAGLVAAGVPGTATITATSGERQGTATITVSLCEGGPALNAGQTVNGTLPTLAYGDYFSLDRFALTVPESGTVQVAIHSEEFNASLRLVDATGLIAQDDAEGMGAEAQIEPSLSRGCYFVDVTTVEFFQTGSYTLTVTFP
jgi:hypothetical protein